MRLTFNVAVKRYCRERFYVVGFRVSTFLGTYSCSSFNPCQILSAQTKGSSSSVLHRCCIERHIQLLFSRGFSRHTKLMSENECFLQPVTRKWGSWKAREATDIGTGQGSERKKSGRQVHASSPLTHTQVRVRHVAHFLHNSARLLTLRRRIHLLHIS